MANEKLNNVHNNFPQFDREFFTSTKEFTTIGKGLLGGKASGLALIRNILKEKISHEEFPEIALSIPRMTVMKTGVFDSFMERNNLWPIALSNDSDIRKVYEFQKASLPAEYVGDLRGLIEKVNSPLAIRSSSKLEDDKEEPFAGIYATKMIPNNQPSADDRFKKLTEAIKYIYASTFFKGARDYIGATNHSPREEKMGVIIQEVLGSKRTKRFYPIISGVGKSYNFYASGRAKPEDGVISLALGLGKTIVDGGIAWSYSPKFPKIGPPFSSPSDMAKNTQTSYWGINMGRIENYNPLIEDEYLINLNLQDAEYDGVLKNIASTLSERDGRIVMGVGADGARIINFAPLLKLNEFRFNDIVKRLLDVCKEELNNPVEIEFAMDYDMERKKHRLGFLQVRAMNISSEEVNVEEEQLASDKAIVASRNVLGNGVLKDIEDIVFVKPDSFETKNSKRIALEIEAMNRAFHSEKKKYLLIGFGRWGSSDPWLGIPVDWSQISSAKVIVEATLPGINVDMSQGSHFFHNLTAFKVAYFSVRHDGDFSINWDWLNMQEVILETENVKRIKLVNPLEIKVDGRTGKGVILI